MSFMCDYTLLAMLSGALAKRKEILNKQLSERQELGNLSKQDRIEHQRKMYTNDISLGGARSGVHALRVLLQAAKAEQGHMMVARRMNVKRDYKLLVAGELRDTIKDYDKVYNKNYDPQGVTAGFAGKELTSGISMCRGDDLLDDDVLPLPGYQDNVGAELAMSKKEWFPEMGSFRDLQQVKTYILKPKSQTRMKTWIQNSLLFTQRPKPSTT